MAFNPAKGALIIWRKAIKESKKHFDKKKNVTKAKNVKKNKKK